MAKPFTNFGTVIADNLLDLPIVYNVTVPILNGRIRRAKFTAVPDAAWASIAGNKICLIIFVDGIEAISCIFESLGPDANKGVSTPFIEFDTAGPKWDLRGKTLTIAVNCAYPITLSAAQN